MTLPNLSDDDLQDIRERLSLSDATTWDDLAALWDAYESAEPKLGEPDVPHTFALRFVHTYARDPLVTPAAFYLKLREAFFQAMTVATEIHAPGKRYFK